MVTQWLVFGESVTGASHKRKNLPNQDAIAYYPDSKKGLPLILAVSDGHGSAKSFRSDIGSRFAVDLTIAIVCEELLQNEQFSKERLSQRFHDIKNAIEIQLPKRLVLQWKEKVKNHWEQNSPQNELEELEKREGAAARKQVESNYSLAYGATLLCVVVTEFCIVYLQLGDGDILCVDANGQTTRPLDRDETLIANETTSLCMDDAAKVFRVRVQHYLNDATAEMPVLILASTDGYSNSFSSEEEFIKIGQDYRQLIRAEGSKTIAEQLTIYLDESSVQGSGDDITLGIIRRIESGDTEAWIPEMETVKQDIAELKTNDKEERRNSLAKKLAKTQNLLIIALLIAIAGFATIPFTVWSFFRLSALEKKVQQLESAQLPQTSEATLEERFTDFQERLTGLEQRLNDLSNSEPLTPAKPANEPATTQTTPDKPETDRSTSHSDGAQDPNGSSPNQSTEPLKPGED